MIIESGAEDIIYTAAVSGVKASFLRPSLEAMGITEERWKETKKINFGTESDALSEEAKAWKTIWSAGQGVTNINDTPSISTLIGKLRSEFLDAIQRQQELLNRYQ